MRQQREKFGSKKATHLARQDGTLDLGRAAPHSAALHCAAPTTVPHLWLEPLQHPANKLLLLEAFD
jgi:hypothetical protein